MAEVLKIFQEGEDILASETNANNNYLLGKISDNASTLQNYVEGEITSIQSSLASVQATLQNSINEMSNKLSSIYDNIAPNYKAGYSISSGWTAPKAGWINARHNQSFDNQYFTLSIDGVVAFETGGGGSYSAGDTDNIELFVGKGAQVTFDGSGNKRVTFFPCKGV
jgi:hypothetical protein